MRQDYKWGLISTLGSFVGTSISMLTYYGVKLIYRRCREKQVNDLPEENNNQRRNTVYPPEGKPNDNDNEIKQNDEIIELSAVGDVNPLSSKKKFIRSRNAYMENHSQTPGLFNMYTSEHAITPLSLNIDVSSDTSCSSDLYMTGERTAGGKELLGSSNLLPKDNRMEPKLSLSRRL